LSGGIAACTMMEARARQARHSRRKRGEDFMADLPERNRAQVYVRT
jgi:hypothetical protein